MSSIEEHSEAGAVRPEKARGYFNNLLLHFRPAVVPERTLLLSLTWGLGGAATLLQLLLFGTGLLLKSLFEPFPDRAYGAWARATHEGALTRAWPRTWPHLLP